MGLALLGFVVNFAVVVVLYCVGFFPRITGSFFESCLYILGRLRLVRDPEAAGRRVASEIEAFHGGFTELRREGGLLLRLSGLTAVQLTAFFLVPYCVLRALGLNGMAPQDVIAAAAFILMISSFVRCPGLPAGRRGASSSSSGCSSGGAGASAWRCCSGGCSPSTCPSWSGRCSCGICPSRGGGSRRPILQRSRQTGWRRGVFHRGGERDFPPAECPPGRGLSCGKGRSFPRIPQTFPPEFVESSKKLSPEQMQESGIFSCKIEKPLDFGRRKAYIDTIEAAVLLQQSWL